jgi:Ca2+-binding EF-hand superfamily protein
LKDTGAINLTQFKEFLISFGCTFNDSEINEFFNGFDQQKTGFLNCDLFSNYFALKGSGNNPNVKPKF